MGDRQSSGQGISRGNRLGLGQCVLMLSLLGCVMLAGACTRQRPVAPKVSGLASYTTNIDDSYVGMWRASNGDVYSIGKSSEESLIIVQSKAGGGAETLSGHIISVNGVRFGEIGVPTSGLDGVPVFAYAKFQARLDTLEYTPIRADWLRSAVVGEPGATFGSAASVDPAAGGVVVRSPALLFQLLQRAAKDNSAFGTTETLTRIR